MASTSNTTSELSKALLEDPPANAPVQPDNDGFLGISSDADSDEEQEALSKTPVIMGSPFPYFFGGKPVKKKESHSYEPIDEGDLGAPPTDKLVKSLVAASITRAPQPSLADAGRAATFNTQLVQEARKRVRRKPMRADSSKGKPTPVSKAIIIGIVNVVVGVPALISYTAIIFQAPEFKPYVGELAQLLFFASAIIQAVFCLRSTLPFAVGQVQDVGLIFLSAMATSIAAICSEAKLPSHEIVGTTLVTCLLATLFVGIMTIVVGKFKLAGLVQYIPLPVVGGYLGYVGFFCLVAGASVSTNMPLESFGDVKELLANRDALYMLVAAVASMLVLLVAMEHFTHPAALPTALVLVPAVFHLVLLATGHTLHEAQEAGWVIKPTPSAPFWKVFDLYNVHDWKFSGTYWPAVAAQIGKSIALFFVVAFGSSMDVAAVQQDMPDPLDFDGELITVGLANIAASVCCAGFTGSYIFSQTIFTKRQGVSNVINGWMIAGAELLLFLLPVSVVEFMPNFFYGSLLMVFGVDISRDWLVHSFHKVTHMEYALLWATFLAVVAYGLEVGIGVGIVLATMYFAIEYAKIRVSAFRLLPSSSGALRTFRQQAVLQMFSSRMMAIGLEGYIFFGSALKIGDRCIEMAELLAAGEPSSAEEGTPLAVHDYAPEKLFAGGMVAQARDALASAPKFLLLDFRQVEGLDATAARTFGTIANQLRTMNIDLIITHVKKASTRALLEAHGVIPEDNDDYGGKMALCFPSTDAGVQFCEECFLEVAVMQGLVEPTAKAMSLPDILQASLDAPRFALPAAINMAKVASQLQGAMEERTLYQGQVLFSEDDPSDSFFIITRGTVRLELLEAAAMPAGQRSVARQDTQLMQISKGHKRVYEFGPGGLVGDNDFFLSHPRSFRAAAGPYGCTLLAMSRTGYDKCATLSPQALLVLQAVMMRNAFMNDRQLTTMLHEAKH